MTARLPSLPGECALQTHCIDEYGKRERQVAVRLETESLLRRSIFEYAHIFALESADESPLFVGGREEDIREIGFDAHHLVGTQGNFVLFLWRRRCSLRRILSAPRACVRLCAGLRDRSGRKARRHRNRDQSANR